MSIEPSDVFNIEVNTDAVPEIYANFSNGAKLYINSLATYEQTDDTVAFLDDFGILGGLSAGTTVVTVSYMGLTATYTVNVSE